MTVFEIIILIFGSLTLIAIFAYLVSNEKQKVIEWLKYAVIEAEKVLGNGTGQLKLRKVYDWFCEKFPVVSTIIPFKIFSSWVDIALEIMHKWIDTNGKIEDYINGND